MTPPLPSDALGIGTLIGGAGAFLTGMAAYIRAKVAPGDPTQRSIVRLRRIVSNLEDKYDECERQRRNDRNETSALRTEISALRKLIPGGEWYRKLGMDAAEAMAHDDE